MSQQGALLLRKQLIELTKCPVEGFSAGLIDDSDIYKWEVLIIGPADTPYEGGFFKAHLTFPADYPLKPPKLKFISEIWHPNRKMFNYYLRQEGYPALKNLPHSEYVYNLFMDLHGETLLPLFTRKNGDKTLVFAKTGEVCISILHDPGEDKYGYERPEERWLPVHTVETIMISVISMLTDPNDESPANIDAAKEMREQKDVFRRKVAQCVKKSQESAWD